MKKAKVIKRLIATLTAAFMFINPVISFNCIEIVNAATARQVENLKRGLTVSAISSGTLVSWRYLGTDSTDTVFKLYRNSNLIYTSNKDMPTCYADTSGTTGSNYTLEVYGDGITLSDTAQVEYTLSYDSTGKGGYFDMTLDRPTDTSGLGATYTPNDASVADLDGDGQYELIIKWDPSNSQDNSTAGDTSNVYIDAYEFESGDATRLWRIDLGQNIRAGAHYTQFMVYDFDGDGCAEMVCKTAPGSKDGKGAYVSSASSTSAIKNASDNTTDYADTNGRILSGSEYLTLFDGATGAALDTIYYEPGRGTVSDWGDNYGNRVDRFLGGVAYLNGKTPSVIMCRGYYTRSVLVAYDVSNKKLVKRWTFDSNTAGSQYAGQGNHSLAVADVDSDGYDEIVYGSMTVDHDGTGLYSTQLGHGDALHVGDFLPNRSGLEVFQVHEETYGASLRDAKDGTIIKRWTASSDTGRGVADNIISGNSEAEFVSSEDSIIYNSSGTQVALWSDITKWNMNSLIYWDGDLEREVLDRSMIDDYPNGRLFTGQNVTYNNASKSNMCITADIFGDWREEIVAPLSDGTGVRVYATPYTTDYRIYTLMHNTAYRCGVAIENVGYNQPPHVDYWLGTGDALPSQPSVYAAAERTALDAGTYDAATMLTDGTKFTVSGSTSDTQVKIGTDGYVEFNVNDNANVVVTYKCGSSDATKSAAVVLNGKTGTTLVGGAGNADLTVTGLAAGTYKITATQTGGTTAQIVSMTVSYGTVESTTEATTETTTETTTQATTPVSGALAAGTYTLNKVNVVTNGIEGIDGSAIYGSDASAIKVRDTSYVSIVPAVSGTISITWSSNAPKAVVVNSDGTESEIATATASPFEFSVTAGQTYKVYGTKSGGNSNLTELTLSATIVGPTTTTTTEATTETTTVTTTTTEATTETTTQVPVVLTALDAGTYDAATMLADGTKFTVSGSTSDTQVKIGTDGYVEFKVNDNANVVVTYKCGSTTAGKTAAIILNGTTGTTLESDGSTADLTVTGLAAGTYKITATQTGGTTAQIVSMSVTYGTPIIKGDADNNGVVEKADVTMIMKYVIGVISNITNPEAADVNSDNKVSIADAYLIQKFINTGRWN